MKTKVQKLLVVMLTVILLCSSMLSVSAVEVGGAQPLSETSGITPRLNNCDSATFTFTVDEDGVASFAVTYFAKSNLFTEAKLTVKIQRKVVLFFWRDVNIGEPNNEWIGYNTNLNGWFNASFNVEEPGTYRAVFTLEISGTGGETDVIEQKIECEY